MYNAPPLTIPGPSDRFALIVDALCRVVAARGARDRAAGPFVILLWCRLRRLLARFTALAARVRSGTLRAVPARGRPAARREAASNPQPRLPARFAWLVRLVPESAVFGAQLRHLLDDPEMAALLAAAPQAARLLRPLCRMLAVEPVPILRPPPPAASRARPDSSPTSPRTPPVRASVATIPAHRTFVPA